MINTVITKRIILGNKVVLWTDKITGKITGSWLDNGLTYFNVPENSTLESAIKIAKSHIKNNTISCCDCGKTIPRNEGNRRFAGIMCKKCWNIYVNKNSRICSICGRPQYDCNC